MDADGPGRPKTVLADWPGDLGPLHISTCLAAEVELEEHVHPLRPDRLLEIAIQRD